MSSTLIATRWSHNPLGVPVEGMGLEEEEDWTSDSWRRSEPASFWLTTTTLRTPVDIRGLLSTTIISLQGA